MKLLTIRDIFEEAADLCDERASGKDQYGNIKSTYKQAADILYRKEKMIITDSILRISKAQEILWALVASKISRGCSVHQPLSVQRREILDILNFLAAIILLLDEKKGLEDERKTKNSANEIPPIVSRIRTTSY